MRRTRGSSGLGFTQHSGAVSSHPLNRVASIDRGGFRL